VIGGEAEDGPSSLYTEPRRLERPEKYEWMIYLHGVFQSNEKIILYGLLDVALGASKEVDKAQN
jgi:hypothetical protein